jgi:Domain of unknown function (DUF5667)
VLTVNPATSPRRRIERFAQLLEEANGRRRHHVRSPLDEELAELVAVGHRVAAVNPTVEVDPEFRTGLRAMLIATAEREGIGVTAKNGSESRSSGWLGRAAANRRTVRRPATGAGRPAPAPSRGRARGAIIVAVAVGAIAVSGMSTASENAMPGDALYGVKRSTEKAQLALAGSEVTRGQLYLQFASTRLAEAEMLREDGAAFSAALGEMDADTRAGTKLLTTAAVQRHDAAALDALTRFATVQGGRIQGVEHELPAAQQQRARESLTLLAAVKKRAAELRPVLRCGTSGTASDDSLGPVPGPCGNAARRPIGAGATNSGATNAAAPGTHASSGAVPDAGTPTAAPRSAGDDGGGILGAIGRFLGGLLG